MHPRPGNAVWGVVDQAVSSAANFVVAILAARQMSPGKFGAFNVASLVCLVAIGAQRALILDPFLIRSATDIDESARQQLARRAMGASVIVSVTGSAIVLVVAVFVAPIRGELATVAVVATGLLAQDAFRYVLFGAGRPRSATINDAVWLGLEVPCVAALIVSGSVSGPAVIAVWGGAAAAAAVLAARQSQVAPAIAGGRTWLAENRDLGVPLVVEYLAVTGAIQLTLFGVAGLAGVEALGSIRAVTLLFGPCTVVLLGIMVLQLPSAVRALDRSVADLARRVAVLGVSLPAFTASWGLGLLAIPRGIGRSLLGESWDGAKEVLVPITVMTSALACVMAASLGLRALGAGRASLRARLTAIPLGIAGGLVGAGYWGAKGAAIGLALGAWTDAGATWLTLARRLDRRSRGCQPASELAPAGRTL